MGTSHSSIQRINFEDMQMVCKTKGQYILINTMPREDQSFLILNTLNAEKEEQVINHLLKNKEETKIIIYGRNSSDDTVYKKYSQLQSLGLHNTYIYCGGMFEWVMLQELYDDFESFPTTTKCDDFFKNFMKYKTPQKLNVQLLEHF
jgi:hypothetical protein